MVWFATEAAQSGEELESLEKRLATLAESSHIPTHRVKEALLQAWEKALDRVLEDSVLSENEESRLMAYAKQFALTQDDLNMHGAYTRAEMAAVLREVLDGRVPSRIKIEGQLPFNFEKAENLVWLFTNASYYEEIVRRSYVGGYQGMSFRVMKGVYYRIGGFRGNPVETKQIEHIDTGKVALPTKHIYFGGSRENFRIPYAKIVSFVPYSDGIGVCRDAASAKPQIFVTGEGWFAYNLVTNLARM